MKQYIMIEGLSIISYSKVFLWMYYISTFQIIYVANIIGIPYDS